VKLATFLKIYGISLTMVVDLLLSFAKDNMSARKTLLCIEYVKQILDATDALDNPELAEEFAALRKHIFVQLKPLMLLIVRPP
jgi:hypothetical protein